MLMIIYQRCLSLFFLGVVIVGEAIMTSQTTMNDTATGIVKVSIASTLVVVVLAYFMTFVVYGLVAGGVWLWQRRSSYELLVNFFSKPARAVNFAVIIGLLLLGSANAYFEDYLPSQTAEKSVNRAIQRNRLRELTTSDRLSAELKRGQAVAISEELTMSNHQHIYLANLKGDNSGIEITLTRQRRDLLGIVASYRVTKISDENGRGI
ncbi:hypothetical protein ACN50C_05550 [Levilactobacillus brevis]|uniref:Uncharacterized protein n=3 Tax=Levilactobacillus brevis TaxID=1580 RepID=Q03TT6_LEVBA|nr:hypothetical protein [Levilactobacillus brevis]ABJ63386.1 hypothetical protein LVIS_0220 [Levilactobacillus brevis ATCC 367]MCS8596288.1 hypothetical protein [Levilactobacillus brevis]MCT2886189.1 hypothetical protein [Levilactobacillus brevis]MCT3563921.1 hypothetical protein [Levilactobacillus brevis]MCT3568408.1 hypothetical protein [Levilactobacillus brevis]